MSSGSSLISQAKRETLRAQDGVVTAGVAKGTRGPAQTTGAFPRGGLQDHDPRDEIIAEKMAHMTGSAASPFGTIHATDADFEWLQRKRETEAYANLDAWISKNFHTADVATRKWLQETFPEFYEARERLMIDRAKFALRIKLLKLRGPKNHKDLVLQWGLQTGRIELDRNWDVIGSYQEPGTTDDATEQARFKKGLFSPYRFMGDDTRKANANNASNPFRPDADVGFNGGQMPSPFPGAAVASGKSRYPDFLSSILEGQK